GGSLHSGFYGQGGDDTATISVGTTGTNFSAALFDGGLGTDTITFLNTTNDGVVGANITNWEKFVVDGSDITFIDNALTLNGYTGSANGVGDFTVQNSGRAVTNTSAADFTLTGNLFLADAASTFVSQGTGSTNITGDVTNSGILSMQDGSPGGNVSIGGNYTSSGGALGIDVNFGSLQSDVVTFGGAINGVTSIQIADVGSSSKPGAILIADTTSASAIDQNEFKIGKTASGIYAYGLLYNLTGNPSIGTTPGLYLYAGGNDLQPFIPLYEAFQSVMLDMNKLPTMRQRVGKGYWVGGVIQPGSLGDEGVAQPAENTWLRIVGGFNHQDPKAAVTGYDYDLTSVEVQAGFDGLFYEGSSGRLVAGPTLRYVNGHASIDSAYGSSSINPHGYGVGGTITWYGSDGFYTDAQAEVTWYESQLKAHDLANGVEDVDGRGYAVSMEIGQQMGGYNGMILTPQAQLYYSAVDIDSFTGAYSDDVAFNKGESLLARMGLALEQQSQWLDANGTPMRGNVYAIANIYHEFLNETTAVVEQSFALTSQVAPWTGEIGFGGTYGWDADGQSYALYGEARASTGLDNFASAYGYAANGGVKIRW
ncbi:MAG TPA: autotransporter outer membrane beta-barrel domain-containing protein, partial [Candidatus Handelsmanbacteria bacterium]|nr:autotransporter outer membrane beta-barrel domain-containing protein [Candidatus Handelsmanbacteria bacterium]